MQNREVEVAKLYGHPQHGDCTVLEVNDVNVDQCLGWLWDNKKFILAQHFPQLFFYHGNGMRIAFFHCGGEIVYSAKDFAAKGFTEKHYLC
jgi:hypothetical protein